MTNINERQIGLKAGGNFSTLKDFLDRRVVRDIPFSETMVVTASAVNVKLIPSTIVPGTLAVGIASVTSGGVVVASLVGAVGTGAITTISDSFGNLLNLVTIRDATTHDPITVGSGSSAREVFGLLQSSNGVADGASIGGVGSENLQISFVYITSGGVITLTPVTATVEFTIAKLYQERNTPTIYKENGSRDTDILSTNINPIVRKFEVTTTFPANAVITLTTGAGSPSGASTASGDTVALPATNTEFYNDNLNRVRLNGVQQFKGSGKDVVWDSTNSLHFLVQLDVGDVIEVERIIQ